MKIETIKPMIPNADGSPIEPLQQDLMLMGASVSRNIEIMGIGLHPNQDIDWFIIVNRLTGERTKVTLRDHHWTMYEPMPA